MQAQPAMDACPRCGAQLSNFGQFCTACGAPSAPAHQPYSREPQGVPPQPPLSAMNAHHAASHGFAQTFGIHPAIAILTLVVDSMLFGTEGVAVITGVPSGGTTLLASLVFSTIVGCILGVITYLAQKKWYGDDKESALIKALILAFLTAIPTNLPAFLYVPAGIVGFFRKKT